MSVILSLLFIGIDSASSAPFDTKQVAADAKWFAHLDFDSLKSTTLAKKVQNRWFDNKMVQKRLDSVKMLTGVNLAKDLHGVTFYGNEAPRPKKGVVILHADFDTKRMANIARRKPLYRKSDYNGHELHTWTKRKPNPREHTIPEYSVTGTVFKPGVLILGENVSEVKAALDVFDGKTVSLFTSDESLANDVPQGTIALASVGNLSDLPIPFKSPIIKQSESVWIVLGEDEGQLFGKGKLVTKSVVTAGQVKEIIQGIRAMVLLEHGSDPAARKLIERLEVTISDKTVHIDWSGKTEAVWKLFEQHEKRKSER